MKVHAPDRRRAAAQRQQRGGAVLLEVVLGLVLFVAAAAIVTAGMNASMDSLNRLRLKTHAMNLAVSVLSELRMGARTAEGTPSGTFDPPYEDWNWELQLQPVQGEPGDTNQLMRVEVVVRHSEEPIVQRLTQWMRLEETRKGTNASVSL